MTKRIFRSVCAAALTVFLVTLLLIIGVLYEYFSGMQRKQLKTETVLAAQGVNLLGAEYFDGLPVSDYRITWISSDGTVYYDSASDSKTMENHLEREEIREAIDSGTGESSRYSSTLMERYLYCAYRLDDGTVLRLSISHGSVLLLIVGMLQPIIVIIVVAVALAFILAKRLSKRIVEPMNNLNLDEPLENDGYDELTPLLRRIHSQQQQLRIQSSRIEQKQKELDAIVGSMEEGMILLDTEGNVITMNRSAKILLDAEKTVTGENILEVIRNPELQAAVQAAEEGESAFWDTELHGKLIQINAAPVQGTAGVSGVAIVMFDITQREKAEQQRREFTANVSHELKTPLHVISGYSELMKCGIAKPEDVQPFSEKIYNEAQRLISVVEDIINLSHLDEGGKDLRWTDLDLYDEAEQAVKSLRDVAGQSGVSISLDGEPTEIRGVPELVKTILYNLCDNAIKYNHPGGSVAVSVHDRTVTVKDTGIGIPKEDVDRIFERFYRVDKSRSKEVGGTGLGLSIVKHAVMIHNGKIEVKSAVGEGTEITVRFDN